MIQVLSGQNGTLKRFFIDFSEAERNVYETIQQLKTHFSDTSLSHMTLLREICSSKEALFCTLKNMLEQKPHLETTIGALLQTMNDITDHAKAKKALELIQTINDKVIVFTEYRATQLYLQWFFKQHGISSVPFRGGFKRSKKDWMKELFQHRAQVLIATEAGGEGINLQFCNHVINYDLPWNPMRLEQRIGRVHRLGQTKDVHIYNFVVRNTVEEHMFTLLYEKIQLFERVVGELDDILMKLQSPTFSNHLERIIAQSKSEGELKIKMQNFVEIFTNMGDSVHAAT